MRDFLYVTVPAAAMAWAENKSQAIERIRYTLNATGEAVGTIRTSVISLCGVSGTRVTVGNFA